MTRQELTKALLFHPLLNTEGDLQVPPVESLVWFSQGNLPHLGKVLEVDPTVSRPLTIQACESMKTGGGLHLTRFRPCLDEDSQGPMMTRITLHQVMMQLAGLTKGGYLQSADRPRLQKRLNL